MSEIGLREKAEAYLRLTERDTSAMLATDVQALFHELQVHQVELEMQNEDLRNTQLQLQATRDKLLDLFDFAPIGYVVISDSSIIQEANLKAGELLGLGRSLLIGRPLARFMSKQSVEPFQLHLLSAAKTAVKQSCELTLQRAKGEPFDASLDILAMAAPDTGPTNFRVAFQDITARKNAERARESNWLQLTENLPDCVLTVDREGSIQFTSRSLPGSSLELRLGSAIYEQFPADQRTVVREALARVFRTGEPLRVELIGRGPADQVAHVALCMGPISEGKAIIAATVVATDITDRKILEEELRQAQKLEAVGLLAGGVAHDFNNLLTVINGYSDIMLRGLDANHPHKELVSMVAKAGKRAAELTAQLLAFGRKQLLAPVTLNLNDALDNSEKLLRRLIGEDIALIVSREPRLERVMVDPSQLDQVIMNLAINARDAMPQGGTLFITTSMRALGEEECKEYPESKPGRYVALTVSDTGLGMPPEVMAHIFEPFFTTKPVGQGTGMGLATVYGIVRQSEGYIGVTSTVGVGSAFTVLLPATSPVVAPLPAEKDLEAQPRGSGTILLVEDEDGVRKLVRFLLETDGYTVLDARNGDEAIRLASEHPAPIDLLLTDVIMPRMSGRQVAEKLLPGHPGMKVLYMSGYADDAAVRHGVSTSMNAFMHKPFTPTALTKKVRELLGQ